MAAIAEIILTSVKTRVEEGANEDLLKEYILTAMDRIKLRAGEDVFPGSLASIAVDVATALYRNKYYECIKTEDANSISTTFVDDLLAQYSVEFEAYKEKKGNEKVVRFL